MTTIEGIELRRPSSEDDAIHIVLPSEGISLERMLKAQRVFLQLIREVGGTVLGTGAVTWIVSGVKEGSLDLAVRPHPRSPDIPVSALPRVSKAVTGGLVALSHSVIRPPYFSDQALERAADLAGLVNDELAITVRGSQRAAPIKRIVAAHAQSVLGEPVTADGSVEGRLETITVHEQRSFSIYDPLTQQRIECNFGHRIPAEAIGAAVEQRVRVYGEVRYGQNGEVESVRATELEVIPPASALPSADEVRGIINA